MRLSRLPTMAYQSHRSKRRKVGSIDWLDAHSDLPPGPATIPELLSWPDASLQAMFATFPDTRAMLRGHLLQGGVCLHTQYTGKGTAESAFTKIGEALVTEKLLKFGDPCWSVALHAMQRLMLSRSLCPTMIRASLHMCSRTSMI